MCSGGAAMPEAAAAPALCCLLAVLVRAAAAAEFALELLDWSASFARVPSLLLLQHLLLQHLLLLLLGSSADAVVRTARCDAISCSNSVMEAPLPYS